MSQGLPAWKWGLAGFCLALWGCPYVGPIEPPPPKTNFRPEIEVKSPVQQSGAIYNAQQDVMVEFEVDVNDPDTPDNELEFAWIVDRGTANEQRRALGNNITLYPLFLDTVVPGPHTMTVRVKDGVGDGANEELETWEFEVQ